MKATFAAISVGLLLLGDHFHEAAAETEEAAAGQNRVVEQAEERQIGVMVKQIKAALAAPQDEASLRTIVQYGTDTRYYVMIRGWLREELAGVESQADAAAEPEAKAGFAKKADFLKQAIRRIDLE